MKKFLHTFLNHHTVETADMCNHKMNYLLKKHDDALTGTMLELQGVFSTGKDEKELEKNLKLQSLAYFNTFKKFHKELVEKEKNGVPLNQTLPRSTSGKVVRLVEILVECPKDVK